MCIYSSWQEGVTIRITSFLTTVVILHAYPTILICIGCRAVIVRQLQPALCCLTDSPMQLHSRRIKDIQGRDVLWIHAHIGVGFVSRGVVDVK